MKRIIFSLSLGVLLAACSDSNNNNSETVTPPVEPPAAATAQFEVRISNLTAGQPFSPVTVFITESPSMLFELGSAASIALENLAESGDNTMLLEEVNSLVETSASDPLAPGANETLSIELDSEAPSTLLLSVITMLVNTNDAIAARQDVDISALAVDDSITVTLASYDAGTEANSETAATIPGPTGGGEGFNADRSDVNDIISGHPGIVSADDGLTGSALSQLHRWDNHAANLTITRIR